MSDQITCQTVETRVDYLNQLLSDNGSTLRVKFMYKYNYFAVVPVYAADGSEYGMDNLVAGSKRDCYDYLCGMIRGIEFSKSSAMPFRFQS